MPLETFFTSDGPSELVCTKISAAGNDFFCIDNREGQFSCESLSPAWVSKLCHRRFGLGADGVLVLESSLKADLRMRVFNADGSEAAMCGNGLRAICLFAFLNGLVLPQYHIETLSGVCIARIQPTGQAEALITTTMPPAADLIEDIPLQTARGIPRVGQYLRVGVPHLLIFLKEKESYSLEEEGPFFRNHKQFAPEGVNVHFVFKQASQWHYRSYERGVEAETWACGSGATAIGAYLAHKGIEKLPLVLMPFSKVPLTIGMATCDDSKELELCAEASALFTLSLSQPCQPLIPA